jgi:riboflavin synthase
MFTGIIQNTGVITATSRDAEGGLTLTVQQNDLAPTLIIGESVAVNGVCLTVVAKDTATFQFQVGPETLRKTTFATARPGELVNLERALRVGDPIGGHFVCGHVDAVGEIEQKIPQGDWHTFWFRCPDELDPLLVTKGSIAVDGISLTLVDVEPGRFSIMIIPHTLSHTTLGVKSVGAKVNLETDLLARHVQKLLATHRHVSPSASS